MRFRKTRMIGLGLGLTLAAAACGGGAESASSSDSDKPLAGAHFTVGSKDFDEQLVLGNISLLALKNAGADVTDEINLGGTNAARAALKNGDIDTYWGYTGTAWISFFKKTQPLTTREAQYKAVRDLDKQKNNLVWMEPSLFNNTYALAFRSEAADKLGNPTKLSDLGTLIANHPDEATLCVENEFSTRDDGLPGMEKTYGYQFPDSQVTVLDTGIVYTATDKGDPCNFGEVFTTDGRIEALGLTVLKDDKGFFPLYNAAPVFRGDVYAKYADQLKAIFNPIAEALTQSEMQHLNKLVSADGMRPRQVAEQWLKDKGFIS